MNDKAVVKNEVSNRPNPAAVYLRGLRQGNTQDTMTRALQRIVDLVATTPIDCTAFPWQKIQFTHAQEIKARLQEHYGPATINQSLVALRRVMRVALRQGQITPGHYEAIADVKNVAGESEKTGRYVTLEEVKALLNTCDDGAKGLRDAAIIYLLFFGAGLRREELAKLNVDHFQEDGLKIAGKGRKHAFQVITEDAAAYIVRWLDKRNRSEGPLFCRVLKSGKMLRRERMTPNGIWYMLKTRAKEAGIEHLTPHDGRRTFISNLLERTDIATVQQLARHNSPTTTARYDRRADQVKLDALNSLEKPGL